MSADKIPFFIILREMVAHIYLVAATLWHYTQYNEQTNSIKT